MKIRQILDPIIVGVVVIFFIAIIDRILAPIGISIVQIDGYVSNPATAAFVLVFSFCIGWVVILITRLLAREKRYMIDAK